jgi:ubiquinone/menaquinone biosynthesis C-methylase UbiE
MNEEIFIKKKDRYKLDSLKSYNKYQKKYDDIFWMKVFSVNKWDESVLEEVQNEIAELHILDIGCATGRLLERLAIAGAKFLYGTDIAANMMKVVEMRLMDYDAKLELKAADVETKLPWDNEKFDVITITGAFHHFYNPNDALHEIFRVLRKDGRLIVLEPRFIIIYRQLLNLYLRIFMHDGDYKFYSPKSLAKLVCNSGFILIERDVKVGWLGYKAIFKK